MSIKHPHAQPGDYDYVENAIRLQCHLIEQRICAVSDDYFPKELTAENMKTRAALYGCVHHQTNHVFLPGVAHEIISQSYSYLLVVLRASVHQKMITVEQKKKLHTKISRMRTQCRDFVTNAQKTHVMLRVFLIDAADREKSLSIKAARMRVKTYADLRQTAANVPLLIEESSLSDEVVAEYYKCFRKKLFFSAHEADNYIKVYQSGQVDTLNSYFCEFCTGSHIGHPPKESQDRESFIRNARRHWNRNPLKANSFVKHMDSIKHPLKFS